MTKYSSAPKASSAKAFRLLCIVILFLSLTHRVSAQEVPTKTIYFLAGPKDHVGGEGTGRHETRRDLLVLQQCIDSAINIKGVKIKTKFLYEREALIINEMTTS